ncbi:FAD/NAD(P)-binding domain-containing protein [Rhizoclosmatium globosum]|uniref:FAD/NAD(P)-binding domain-containing protein n=1 Tax=Rhizoclosmatium globosum TaxID=329046 RepID=A0A1Y2BTZ9_9FUNG|nr:FAD/NAD(P)-binding domain-containing protein [Rhizoclosmatium globosum]|eukprot:ORY38238.1 FAD/NAD(P)-binding domain-containing protein [Rhizoclosmatium globosum]
MPKVVIIGGGLVGAATALGLHQIGIQSTVYDQVNPVEAVVDGRAIEFGDSGGAVLIQAGGLRVLRTLGLLDECLAAGQSSSFVSWHKIDGSAQIVGNTKAWNQKAGETDPKLLAPLQILRSTLHTILIKACHRVGIKTLVNKKLVDVKQDDSSVTAFFADGSTATGDILIGADGIHSATRHKVFGEHLNATFTSSIGHIGVVNIKEHGITIKETEECSFFVDRDKKLFVAVFKSSADTAAINVSTFDEVTVEGDDQSASYRPYTDLPKHAGHLADVLKSWGVPPHLEKMMRHSHRLSSYSVYDLPDMDSYRKGRVILIGDAAHGMVPSAGLGLLTGLEDVGTLVALFRNLPEEKDLNRVLELYSDIRVAREQQHPTRLAVCVSTLIPRLHLLEEVSIILYSVLL